MEFPNHIFKAYDIRGKVPTELNADLAERVGKALAEWLPTEGPVAVGRDMRPDSEELAKAAIAGLQAQGRDVWDIGQVTSDMIYFAVGDNNLAGGLMVTASHNPGEYNGIKVCREQAGGISLDAGLDQIRDAAAANEFTPAETAGTVVEKNLVNDWIDHVLSFVSDVELKPFKVVVDAGNGMAGAIVPHMEGKVPFSITPMYFELDGTFPNHEANPLKEETLEDLRNKIVETGADVGIAFDGDGDRAVLLDEAGRPVAGSIMTAVLADYFIAKNPGATILYNLICSHVVKETIEKAGGTAVRTRVGHSYIKQQMKENNGIFAGEHSAHYYFRDNYNADSGLIAAIVGIAVLSASGKTLSELVEQYRVYTQSGEQNFEVQDQAGTVERIKAAYADTAKSIDELDGLTVEMEDFWFNVRASNTEPLLRLNLEAKDQATCDAKVAEVAALIQA